MEESESGSNSRSNSGNPSPSSGSISDLKYLNRTDNLNLSKKSNTLNAIED